MWLRSYGERAPIDEDRLRALRHALTSRKTDARSAAAACDNTHLAAALRGRAKAYQEAIELVDKAIDGAAFRRPKRVRRADKARLAPLVASREEPTQ